tara:strand:+ start:860 stop:1384 length:525 start_codon:yes stop_codon:yes gene_type:complete
MLDLLKESYKDMWVIFDLDGTIANIEERRKVSQKENGKLDWSKFFDPENIQLDTPNSKIITLLIMLKNTGFKIAILSGRSKVTKLATVEWLKINHVPYNILKMRPTHTVGSVKPNHNKFEFMPDDKLKEYWLNDLFPKEDRERKLFMVFDDRDKVVKMWRKNNITCLQVADGEF